MLPFDDVLERIKFGAHYAGYFYISTLDVKELGPSIQPLLPKLALADGSAPDKQVLFVGGSKSGTHLHYDVLDNIVVSLSGEKTFHFFHPRYKRALSPFSIPAACCNFSSLSDEAVLSAFQAAPTSDALKITLYPGELLFVPSGWWHRVINIGFTISIANFWPLPPLERLRWRNMRLRVAELNQRCRLN